MADLTPFRIALVGPAPLSPELAAHVERVTAGLVGPVRAASTSGPGPGHPAWHGLVLTGRSPAGTAVDVLLERLRVPARAAGADVAVTQGLLAEHGPGLVVLDVDSTLITAEVVELLAAHAGTAVQVAEVTERAMRGELDFAASLRERVATLAGLPERVLAEVGARVELTPGARELVAAVHAAGGRVGLVSGGFIEIVGPLAAGLRIDHVHANALQVRDGRLTGRTRGEVVDRAVKARRLREWAAVDGVPLARTVAVGDGANDLDMLAAAGLGVAFCAKPVLRRAADTTVSFPRLDAVTVLAGLVG